MFTAAHPATLFGYALRMWIYEWMRNRIAPGRTTGRAEDPGPARPVGKKWCGAVHLIGVTTEPVLAISCNRAQGNQAMHPDSEAQLPTYHHVLYGVSEGRSAFAEIQD